MTNSQSEWHANDKWIAHEWHVNDKWITHEWHVNDIWMTYERTANDMWITNDQAAKNQPTAHERTPYQHHCIDPTVPWSVSTHCYYTFHIRTSPGYRWACGFQRVFIPTCPPSCFGKKPATNTATATDGSRPIATHFVRPPADTSTTSDDALDIDLTPDYICVASPRRQIDTPLPRRPETSKDETRVYRRTRI